MRKTCAILLMLSVLVSASLFAGCAQSAATTRLETTATEMTTAATTSTAATESAPTKISVTDMSGRPVTLDAPADKIVALTPSDCEILYAIGAGDTLVGRGEYCDYPAEVNDLPAVKSGSETNIEEIIALQPQVVVMSMMAQTPEQVAALEKAGIKVVASDASSVAGVYEAISLIGAVTGKNQEAGQVIAQMKATFDEITAKSDVNNGKTIYFEVSPLQYGLWTAGKGTFMDELAGMLGLTNAFADVEGWGEITQEQVIERDPDYIVTIAMYFGEGVKPVDEILERDGWQNMKAIKNKMIFNADSNEISRPGPRLANAIQSLYDFVYPAGGQ